MAYDEDLAHRLREQLAGESGVSEKAMFGGLGWVLVAPEGVATERELGAWIARGVTFARSLPPKA